jgi:hypothetical protein
MCGTSKTYNPEGKRNNPNEPNGWLHATARPSSSAAPATKTSTPDVHNGNHYEHWRAGCPETGHVRFGGGPSEKDQHQLAPRQRPTLQPAGFGPGAAGKGPANRRAPRQRPTGV